MVVVCECDRENVGILVIGSAGIDLEEMETTRCGSNCTRCTHVEKSRNYLLILYLIPGIPVLLQILKYGGTIPVQYSTIPGIK